METKDNWFVKILKSIIQFLGELFKETTPAPNVAQLATDIDKATKELKARELLGAISEDAKDVIIAEGSQFLIKNYKILLNLTKEQKDYAINMAYIVAIENLQDLSVDELLEYRKLITKTAEMGPDVAEQLNTFWNEFKECVSTIVDKVSDISIRAGAIALKSIIPALSVL